MNSELLYGDDFYSGICEAVNKPIFINYEKSLTYINNDPNSKVTLNDEGKIDSLRHLLAHVFYEQICIDSTVVDTTFGKSSAGIFKKIISQSLYNFKNGNGFGCQISQSCLAASLEKSLTKKTKRPVSNNKVCGLLNKYASAGLIELVTEGYKPEIKRKDTQYIQVNPSLLLYLLDKDTDLMVRIADHLSEIFNYRIDKKTREEGSKDAGSLQGFNFSVKIGSRAILANKIEDLPSTCFESKNIKEKIIKTLTKKADGFARIQEAEAFVDKCAQMYKYIAPRGQNFCQVIKWESRENLTTSAKRDRNNLKKILRKYGGMGTGMALYLFLEKGVGLTPAGKYTLKSWLNVSNQRRNLSYFCEHYDEIMGSQEFSKEYNNRKTCSQTHIMVHHYFREMRLIPPDHDSTFLKVNKPEDLKEV